MRLGPLGPLGPLKHLGQLKQLGAGTKEGFASDLCAGSRSAVAGIYEKIKP
jgi:hypothetical protein